MTTLFQCDWCEDIIENRDEIVLADLGGAGTGRLHICHDCLPDHIKSHLDLMEVAP